LGALVLTSPESVYYFTGYPTLPTSGNPILYSLNNVFPYSVVITRDGTRHLVCWGFSVQDVEVDAEKVVPFYNRSEALSALADTVATVLASSAAAGPRRLGVESACPYELAELLAGTPGVLDVRTSDGLLARLRRHKSAAEVALLAECVRIAEGAIDAVMASLRVGASRLDAIRLAKRSVLDLGGDGVGHVTMSFGLANPEIAIDETLAPGSLVVVDVGAKLAGYTSDCRRYAYVGEIPAVVSAKHSAMCQIVDRVAAAMKPGRTFAELFEIAKESHDALAVPLSPQLTHLGHGIGLNTEEEWIQNDKQRAIEEGMVVAIELYTQADGYGLIGDEETYVVRASGPERLSLQGRTIRQISQQP
jgi:Xaa-Pro aminopeptidase